MSNPTAFATIVAGVAGALQAAHPSLTVHVNRTRPVSASEAQAIVVRLDSSRRDTTGPLGATDWQTVLQVECVARTPTGSDPAAAADALLASTWQALLAAPLQLPGVLDLDADPEIVWDFDAGETPLVAASFRLVVRHRTLANSLTPWST